MSILALIPVAATAAHVLAVVFVACILILLISRATMSPTERMVRERRRHAERTMKAMRTMSRIRAETIRRMDRAEERRWS
jgi:ABC-type bacteriocin/lantibiotic exporter with double-glycine peptidase domain